MRTLTISLIVIVVLLAVSSAVVADDYAKRNAAAGVLANCTTDGSKSGNPFDNRIVAPLPISLVKFYQQVQIYPVVTIVNGDSKDQVKAEAAIKMQLKSIAKGCNFSLVGGSTRPANSLLISITIIKDAGQSSNTTNNSDSDSWGGSDRHGSNHRSDSYQSSTSGEQTFVESAASGSLDLIKLDGSSCNFASVDDINSANVERTGSSNQDSSHNSYSYSSRKSGSYGSDRSSSSGSSFQGDEAYSRSKSSRITITEAIEKAVFCILRQGIVDYNDTRGGTITGGTSAEQPTTTKTLSSGYTGDPRYIAEDIN